MISTDAWGASCLAALAGAAFVPLLVRAVPLLARGGDILDVPRPVPILAAAFACAGIGWRYGLTVEALQLATLSLLLIAISWVDLSERRIPNVCLLAACMTRVAYFGIVALSGRQGVAVELRASVVAMLAIAALLLGFSWVTARLLGEGSFGAGDVKLLAVVGLYLGFFRTHVALGLACLGGVLFACAGGRSFAAQAPGARADAFPFAPAIAVATWTLLVVAP